jgi:hypothetical protein
MVDYNGGRDFDALKKFVENDGQEAAEDDDEDDEEEEDIEDEEEDEEVEGHDEL